MPILELLKHTSIYVCLKPRLHWNATQRNARKRTSLCVDVCCKRMLMYAKYMQENVLTITTWVIQLLMMHR